MKHNDDTGNALTDVWINPTGGMGDVLMLSGVLKQCLDKDNKTRYNLVRRSIYSSILREHPAIGRIGHPPADAQVITTDYWAKEKLGKGDARAYQILARMFGLRTPVEEDLFLPGPVPGDDMIHRLISEPGKTLIAIAPSSASPRKMIPLQKWVELIRKLRNLNYKVIQLGGQHDIYIPGAFSLLGQTTPQQLIGVLKNCKLLIGVDNFIMHAAHLVKLDAIIVWGPTDPEIYGYPEHRHVQNPKADCKFKNECLGPETPDNYSKPCPLYEGHCMNLIAPEKLFELSLELLKRQN